MMKTKVVTLFLALSMLFAFAGCGSDSSSEAGSSAQSGSVTTSESSSQPESEATSESSATAEESSSNAESSAKTYTTEIYKISEDLSEGSYLITCTETSSSLEILVFSTEENYEAFQDTKGLSVGDYRVAVETYAWVDSYMEQDSAFFIRLEEGNVLVLDDGKYELQEFDSADSTTLYSGLYVVGEDIAVGEYDVTCDTNSLHTATFAGEEEYMAYHAADRASVGDETDALEQYAVDSDYFSMGDMSLIRLEDGMILIVENGTATLSEWYTLSE